MTTTPSFEFEDKISGVVAGVDEAGCGPWAGPVLAAAVILHRSLLPASFYEGIKDSKQIIPRKRQIIYQQIITHPGVIYGVGVASVAEIDEYNIWGATQLAMQRAVAELAIVPNHLLIDGKRTPNLNKLRQLISCETIIRGDEKSFSIAAASIIAKESRDEIMQQLHQHYPNYGWNTNVGYGTALHQRALHDHGVTPWHRKSFAPVKELLLSINTSSLRTQ